MKDGKIIIYNEYKMRIGTLIIKASDIDDIMFAVQDEIDKKEIENKVKIKGE